MRISLGSASGPSSGNSAFWKADIRPYGLSLVNHKGSGIVLSSGSSKISKSSAAGSDDSVEEAGIDERRRHLLF